MHLAVLTHAAFLLFWYRVLPGRRHLPLDGIGKGREWICDETPGLPVMIKER